MHPLRSDRPLIVYLDFKSPYACLACEPTRRLARDLGIAVDWRPFVLDIPSYLGSARLGSDGSVVEQQRSPEQWSGVKYAYYDCRRYAVLAGRTLRGTVKIWDTNLVATALLWARRQGDEIALRFIDAVYEPFWKRELDVEDMDVVRSVLARAGAATEGFDTWARGEGAAENTALQEAAFAAGIFGVPTFVVDGELYFGREHLPRVRWHLEGRRGPAPDIANPIPGTAQIEAVKEPLEVVVDVQSPASYLALAPTLALAAERNLEIDWHAVVGPPLRRHRAPAGADRSAAHRAFRGALLEQDLQRYAPHPLRDVHAIFDAAPASMGLLWVRAGARERSGEYLARVFERFWRDGRAIDTVDAVAGVLGELGIAGAGDFAGWAATAGPPALAEEEARLRERGVISTPTYLLGAERFLGRQHLPLLRRLVA